MAHERSDRVRILQVADFEINWIFEQGEWEVHAAGTPLEN